MGNDSGEIIGVIVTLLILGLLPVLARIYVRAVIKRNFGWDDWLIALSTVGFCIHSSVGVIKHADHTGVASRSLVPYTLQPSSQLSPLASVKVQIPSPETKSRGSHYGTPSAGR